jgi:hypothetical protein
MTLHALMSSVSVELWHCKYNSTKIIKFFGQFSNKERHFVKSFFIWLYSPFCWALASFSVFLTLYTSAVQRSYVLGHNSLMPMEVRAPPHYYYYYYYHRYLIRTTPTTTTTTTTNNNNNNNNNVKIFNSTQTFKNVFCLKI